MQKTETAKAVVLAEDVKKILEKEGTEVVDLAEEFGVESAAEYAFGLELLDDIKAIDKKILEKVSPICDATNKAHKAATTLRTELRAPGLKAEKIVKDKLDAYDREQRRIQEEKDRAAEAERRAEEEAIRKEQERLLEEAADLETRGEETIAEGLVDEAEELETYVPPPVEFGGPPPEDLVPRGMDYRDNWKAVVLTPDLVPREYCSPDLVKLNKLAKETEGKGAPPGVIFKNERIRIRRG